MIADVIETQPRPAGLCHVAAEPINKFDLLQLVRDAFGIDIEIEPDDELVIDRSLDGVALPRGDRTARARRGTR